MTLHVGLGLNPAAFARQPGATPTRAEVEARGATLIHTDVAERKAQRNRRDAAMHATGVRVRAQRLEKLVMKVGAKKGP